MEQFPSWETNGSKLVKKIPHFMDPKFRYCIHKRRQTFSNLSQINPVHASP